MGFEVNRNENQIKQAIMKELFVIQKEKEPLNPNYKQIKIRNCSKKRIQIKNLKRDYETLNKILLSHFEIEYPPLL